VNKKKLNGMTALVTGASSGLGVDFAAELARHGADLVLVARREKQLQQVAVRLSSESGIDARWIALDLAKDDAPARLYNQLHEEDIQVDILVNNAGFGLYGSFLEIPWEREREMLQVDIIALTHLTKLFAQAMVARQQGYILQVSSIGAFQPSPTYASYSAAKSYVQYFSEALDYELRNSGVSVTTISPGIVATEFLKVSGQTPTLYQRMMVMQSQDVARIGIRAMLNRRTAVIPGFLNLVFSWFAGRLIPRRLAAHLAHRMMTIY